MRVRLKKGLVLLVNASSLFGNFERWTVIGPTCRQETEKLEGSSFSPKGCPQPPRSKRRPAPHRHLDIFLSSEMSYIRT